MKKTLILLSALMILLISCGNQSSQTTTDASEEKVKIGITQIVAHPALDKAREGFKDALKEAGIDAEYEEQNANGEISTANLIATNLVAQKVDLIYAIATPTAQAVVQATDSIPVVFSAITDPESAGVIHSNVTGVSDRVDIKQQLELLLQLDPSIKSVGVIFNSSEQNSIVQVEDLKKAAAELGIEIIERSVTQASEIPQATANLVVSSDAIYLPTDNLVASVVNLITDKASSDGKIVFGAEGAHVEGGALITQGIDYYELGKKAGELAVEIIKNGKNPSDLELRTMELNDIVINEGTLNILGIEIPENIRSKAKLIN